MVGKVMLTPDFLHRSLLSVSFRFGPSKPYTCITIGLLGTSLWRQHSVMLIGETLYCSRIHVLGYHILLTRLCNLFHVASSKVCNSDLWISHHMKLASHICFSDFNVFHHVLFSGTIFPATSSFCIFLVGFLFFSLVSARFLTYDIIDYKLLSYFSSSNRKTGWRGGRKLWVVAFLYSYRCWSKPCLVVGSTQKCSFCWSLGCCFWLICN